MAGGEYGGEGSVGESPMTTAYPTHFHCPYGCERPQPFERDRTLYCGRCWDVDGKMVEVIECADAWCDEDESDE